MARFFMEIETQLITHFDGHFYRTHQDNRSAANRSRQITFVYYFHRTPKQFTGGDLLLYDTDFKEHRYAPILYTRIKPLNNSVIFFPSGYYHEVTPVSCHTKQWNDGRFSLNGWLRKKDSKD